MKKPSGEREGPTEPFKVDADVEDGPTVQLFVPSEGAARVMGLPDFAGEIAPDAKTLKQARNFAEITNSDFYTTRTRETERDAFEDAKTLERRPRSGSPPSLPRSTLPRSALPRSALPRSRPPPSSPLQSSPAPSAPPQIGLPSFADAPPPVDSAEAWTLPRPPRPPPRTLPIPLIPPPLSSPFPLLEKPGKSFRLSRDSEAEAEIEVSSALSPVETAAPARWDTLVSPQRAPLPPVPESFPRPPDPTLPPTDHFAGFPPPPEIHLGAPPQHAFVPKGSIPPPGISRPAHPSVAPSPLDLSKDRTVIAAAVGVFAALTFGGLIAATLFLLLRSPDASQPAAGDPPLSAPPALAPIPAPPEATPPANAPRCRLVLPPRLLAPQGLASVRPEVATAPGASQVAVGIASDRYEARGLIVNLQDLSAETRLAQRLTRPVFRVTPLPGRSPATFVIDTDDARVSMLRTVPSSPPYKLGATQSGIVRVDEGREPSVVWPYSGQMGEPVFVRARRVGMAVAFLRGQTAGDAVFGWLSPAGARDTALERVDVGSRFAEAPAIAGNDDTLALAVAAKSGAELSRIFVASAPHGKLPLSARRMDESPSPEAERHPSLIALDRGFLVSWVAGPAGAQRLRARTLAEDMSPQGPILELSSTGVTDAPGALVARQGRVLAAHYRDSPSGPQLFGSALACE